MEDINVRRHALSPYTPKEVTMNDELKVNFRVISLVSKRGVGKINLMNVTIYRFSRLVKRTKQQGKEI